MSAQFFVHSIKRMKLKIKNLFEKGRFLLLKKTSKTTGFRRYFFIRKSSQGHD
jgi:hypothetical protein